MRPGRAALLGLSVLLAAAAPLAADIRLAGSDLLGDGFAAAMRQYSRESDTRVLVRLIGSRPGLELLRSGDADLGLFALPPGEVPPGEPFVSRVIAYQPAVVVVPEKLPLTQLTVAQLRGIFAAAGAENYTTWDQLGLTGEWSARGISLHVVEPRSALTWPLLRRELLNGAELKTLALLGPLDRVAERVRTSASGIGLVPLVPKAGAGLRALALATSVRDPAYLPTAENLHDGSYPLRLPLYVSFRRADAPRLLPLLRFLFGEECGEALAESHFVPLPVAARHQLLFELEGLD